MHTAYTETLFAPRPRKNIGAFLEPMKFIFSHGDHIQENTNFTFLYNVNNGCTDDVVQRSSCLTREELLCQQLHSEEKQYDFFVSRVNQEVLFPLQQ
ncbi:1384_t:CDS:2, partial [Racocetra fulgida]